MAQTKSVLVVHEDARTRRTMRDALTRDMILITNEAASADAAFAMCRRKMPDVIVVYYNDSRIGVEEFCRDIRHMNVQQPAILFVVAEDEKGIDGTVKAAWGSGYVVRSVTSSSVRDAFRRARLIA